MNAFFCDIKKTFDGHEENRGRYLLEFRNSLLELMKNLGINDLAFRFITSDDTQVLLEYVNEIEPYFRDTPIRLTSQFSSNQRYKNGKTYDIPFHNKIDQVRFISKDRDNDMIFFADDSKVNQIMIRNILKKECPGAHIVSFVPGTYLDDDLTFSSDEKGIAGLVDSIDNFNKYVAGKHKNNQGRKKISK